MKIFLLMMLIVSQSYAQNKYYQLPNSIKEEIVKIKNSLNNLKLDAHLRMFELERKEALTFQEEDELMALKVIYKRVSDKEASEYLEKRTPYNEY